jgi:hypothetical protein
MEEGMIKKNTRRTRKKIWRRRKSDGKEQAERREGNDVAEENAQGAVEPFIEWQNKNEYNVEKVGWGLKLVQKEEGEECLV